MSRKNKFPLENKLFSSNIYPLLVASLGLGTLSVGQIWGGDIRVWELLFTFYVSLVLIKIFVGRRYFAPTNRIPFILLPPLIISVFLSGFNANRLDMWAKQTLFFAALLLLFFIMCQRQSRSQLIQNLRWIIYPSVLVAGWGILGFAMFPENLPAYYQYGFFTPRARSFFVEPNEFSQFLVLPFGFLISSFFFHQATPRWERLFYLFGLFIVVIAQILTFSRGGLLAFTAVMMGYVGIMMAFRNRNTIKKQILWIMFLTILFTILLALLRATMVFTNMVDIMILYWGRVIALFRGGDITALIRLDSILFMLKESIKSPTNFLVGIGLGNLPVFMGAGIATTTNLFVDIYSELGLLGLISFCGILVPALTLPLKTIRFLIKTDDKKLMSVYTGAYLSFIGLLFGGLTYSTHMLNTFWFLCGLLLSRAGIDYRQQPDKWGGSEC